MYFTRIWHVSLYEYIDIHCMCIVQTLLNVRNPPG